MKRNLTSTYTSRQYMLSRDFEVYYYSDANPLQADVHTHDYYEFYFFLGGNTVAEIEGHTYPLRVGDVELIPPGTAHRHRPLKSTAEEPYRRIIFWLSREYAEDLTAQAPAYRYLFDYVEREHRYIFHNDTVTFNAIQRRVISLIEETRADRFGRQEKITLCISDLLLYLNRLLYERHHRSASRDNRDVCDMLIDYIENHLDEDLSLDALAGRFFVSKYYLSHLMKDNLGISLHQYITKKRLAACRAAILNHEKITEVCRTYGFKDYSSFFRAFRREYGTSPQECQELGDVPVSVHDPAE